MKQQTSSYQDLRIPVAGDRQRIGLFGGSFNPPHEGHLNLCDLALKQLQLDQIWWMVTPGNPLKDTRELPSLLDRIVLCKELVTDNRIKITGFEASHKVRYTADTVRLVKRLRPRQKFVWLMGADNLATFHTWQQWQDIFQTMPIAVFDRPGFHLKAMASPAAHKFKQYQINQFAAKRLATKPAPAWSYLTHKLSPLSSTQLRLAEKNLKS